MTAESEIIGKRILITGGTGTVGCELIKRILPLDPKVLRIFSRDENKHFHLQEKLRSHRNVRFFIGDVRDKERLIRAMEDVDIVFHLAAMKHVEGSEYNPFEAIKTNVHGTQNVIDAALENKVSKVVFTSTDKAVNPANAMGASKLMAEKLMVAANYYKGSRDTTFCSVRFGNVLCSSGSVIPRFVDRIKNGRKIDLTDTSMTRYAITFSQAIDLIFMALETSVGGEVIIRRMPVIRIKDLAEILQEELCPLYGKEAPGIRITGLRAGEKLDEELVTEEESRRTVQMGNYLIVSPQIGGYEALPDARPIEVKTYSSGSESIMEKYELRELLYNENILSHLFHGEGYSGGTALDNGWDESPDPKEPPAVTPHLGGIA